MIIRALVSVAALAGLALIGSTPALASQPYPLNYKTFSLGAADATLVGTSFSGGALKLASNGLGTFAYTDPFANANGDGVDGSANYRYGSWTSGTTALFPFNELVQKPRRSGGDGVDGALEGDLVRLRRLREAADLPDVLERRVAHLLLGRGGLEVVERMDVSAHGAHPSPRWTSRFKALRSSA